MKTLLPFSLDDFHACDFFRRLTFFFQSSSLWFSFFKVWVLTRVLHDHFESNYVDRVRLFSLEITKRSQNAPQILRFSFFNQLAIEFFLRFRVRQNIKFSVFFRLYRTMSGLQKIYDNSQRENIRSKDFPGHSFDINHSSFEPSDRIKESFSRIANFGNDALYESMIFFHQ